MASKNAKRAHMANKVIATIYGNKQVAAIVLTLLLLFSWVADLSLELIKGNNEHIHLWLIFTFSFILPMLYFHFKPNASIDAMHRMKIVSHKKDRYQALIYSVSFNSSTFIKTVDNEDDYPKWISEEAFQRSNYFVPYKILKDNSSINALILIASKQSIHDIPVFKKLMHALFPELTIHVLGDAFSHKTKDGVDYSNLQNVFDIYDAAFEFTNQDLKISQNKILIDVTGGTVTNSVAGAALVAESKQRHGVMLDTFSDDKALQYFDINAES